VHAPEVPRWLDALAELHDRGDVAGFEAAAAELRNRIGLPALELRTIEADDRIRPIPQADFSPPAVFFESPRTTARPAAAPERGFSLDVVALVAAAGMLVGALLA
jgi:hypothetical protein